MSVESAHVRDGDQLTVQLVRKERDLPQELDARRALRPSLQQLLLDLLAGLRLLDTLTRDVIVLA